MRRSEGEDGATPLLRARGEPAPQVFLAAPAERVPQLFRSEEFRPASRIRVRPVLTPDNYVEEVTELLRGAHSSVLIQQQYIRARQPETARLLAVLRQRLDEVPGFDLRIVLGRTFDADDLVHVDALTSDFGLQPNQHVRFINLNHFVHCHNKLVIVDAERVLVGSQNWSDHALTRNREASLLLDYPELALYFGRIFESDWQHATAEPSAPHAALLHGVAVVGERPLVPLELGDIVEV
jgi:phosphatidylserine/phosphatidylglycerophosphate/cardiolipin synthase-like enzyme